MSKHLHATQWPFWPKLQRKVVVVKTKPSDPLCRRSIMASADNQEPKRLRPTSKAGPLKSELKGFKTSAKEAAMVAAGSSVEATMAALEVLKATQKAEPAEVHAAAERAVAATAAALDAARRSAQAASRAATADTLQTQLVNHIVRRWGENAEEAAEAELDVKSPTEEPDDEMLTAIATQEVLSEEFLCTLGSLGGRRRSRRQGPAEPEAGPGGAGGAK